MNENAYLQKHLSTFSEEENGCYVSGKYVGCIKTLIEGYMAVTNTAFVKESSHHRGTSKRLKSTESSHRTLKYSHSNSLLPIPFMGFLFEILGVETWKCHNGSKQAENKGRAVNKKRKRKDNSESCSAMIHIRSIKLYSDPTLKLTIEPLGAMDKKLQETKRVLLEKLLLGTEVPFTVVYYCRFPLSPALTHNHLLKLDPSNNRLDARLTAKIKELASSGIYEVENVRSMLKDYVRNTLFAHAESDEMPQNDNTRYFPSDRTIRNHIALAVGPVKRIPGYVNPRKKHVPETVDDLLVKEIVSAPNEGYEPTTHADGVGMIAVHLGAGYHSDERWPGYRQLCQQALLAGVRLLRDGASAGEAVTTAVKLLEDSELTNAGFGSNLTERGNIECDASVMDASHINSKAGSVTYGAVSCVSCVKNPVEAAYHVSMTQAKNAKLSLGRIIPCSLCGSGAENWARAHGVEMCEKNDLASESALKTWQKYQRRLALQLCEADHLKHREETVGSSSSSEVATKDEDTQQRLDTVGAVALDIHGKVAAAASSGGLLMKLPGRVGQAATYGCGCWAELGSSSKPSVATATTGAGEELIYTMLAKKVADELQSRDQPYEAVQHTLLQDFLNSSFLGESCDRLAGVLALHQLKCEDQCSTELVWGHTTRTMLVGHMSTRDKKPEVVLSRLPDNAVPGKSLSVSGTWIKVSTENSASHVASHEETALPVKKLPGQVDGREDDVVKFDDDLSLMWLSDDVDGLSQEQCSVKLSQDFNRRVLPEFETCIKQRWKERIATNPRLFNGMKFRIDSVTPPSDSTKQLTLNIGLTCYRDYMETNWAKEIDLLHDDGLRRHDNTQAFLADPLGVAGIVLTSDNKVIIQQRNHWVAEGAGQLDVPGGHPEPSACRSDVSETSDIECFSTDDVIKEVFASVLKEVRDEVNIPLEMLGKARLIGIVSNKLSGGRPVAYFVVKCSRAADQITEMYKKGGAETDESTDLIFLPEKDFVYLQRDSPKVWTRLCPNGKAACSLYSVQCQKRGGLVPFQTATK